MIYLGWPHTSILPISASQVVRIIAVIHRCLAHVLLNMQCMKKHDLMPTSTSDEEPFLCEYVCISLTKANLRFLCPGRHYFRNYSQCCPYFLQVINLRSLIFPGFADQLCAHPGVKITRLFFSSLNGLVILVEHRCICGLLTPPHWSIFLSWCLDYLYME
jgi:hypothetical protein